MNPVRRDDPLPEAELTFLLGMAFQLVLAEFNDRVAAVGEGDLRPVHGMVFQLLARTPVTSSELAERLGVTKQAAGQIVDDLERRGYVRRDPHPAGGRRKLLVLTDAARAHLAVATASSTPWRPNSPTARRAPPSPPSAPDWPP